jgi:hypothetical protein
MLGSALQAVATVVVVFAISEIGKRWSTLGAAIAALPLATMLVVAKIAYDGVEKGGGIEKANEFVLKFFYLFWPGLLFVIVLPIAQKLGLPFWWSLAIAITATLIGTWGWILLLEAFGVKMK